MNIKKLSEVLYTDQPSENAHVIVEDGGKLARTDVPTSNLAPAYDSTATYAKDDFCVNGGKLYQCNADIPTAEAFNPAHWTEVKVTEVMGGGGGVTPEIMAQIENAQWKTETSEQLFSETADTTESGRDVLAFPDALDADTLIIEFNGVKYVCQNTATGEDNTVGLYGDLVNTPFRISCEYDARDDVYRTTIQTESYGTHTVTASINTVTTTDTFKQAVNEVAGWKTTGEATLFDESVTTVAQDNFFNGNLVYSELITSDTLNVTFNGQEYTCPKIAVGERIYAYGGIGESGPEFTEFPFAILSNYDGEGAFNEIYTPSAGTYTVAAVGNATVYTGEFQKAVKSLSGLRRVSSPQDADIVVLELPYAKKINVRRIVFSASDPTAITSTDGTMSIDTTTIYYRRESDIFENGNFTLSRLGSSSIDPSLYYKGGIQQTANGVTITCCLSAITLDASSNAKFTYYALGLSNLIWQ